MDFTWCWNPGMDWQAVRQSYHIGQGNETYLCIWVRDVGSVAAGCKLIAKESSRDFNPYEKLKSNHDENI